MWDVYSICKVTSPRRKQLPLPLTCQCEYTMASHQIMSPDTLADAQQRSRQANSGDTHSQFGSARRNRNPSKPRNVSQIEQWASLAAGTALLVGGLQRGRLGGLVSCLAGGSLLYRGLTGHCHAYDALGIDTSKHSLATSVPAQQGDRIDHALVVNRSAKDLYDFWRDLKNLPKVLRHVGRIDVVSPTRSHWVAKGPMGTLFEWDAEIHNEREPELIAWRSLPGSQVETAGSVHFRSLGHDRGTAVSVTLKYNPPGGKIGAAIATILGQGMQQELEEDLRQFKSIMEAGEVATIDGQPQGL
jgi:uncharacterized membrane protein